MRSAIESVRQLGLVDALLLIAGRLLGRVTRGRVELLKYYFMAQPVPAATSRATRSGGIAVEELGAGDPRLAAVERPAAELARRFASGSRCFAAFSGDELAGFLWFTDRQYDEDEARCTFRLHPADAAVWDYDVHIVPRFRLGRTFALLWERAFAAMREQRARWSISRVSAFKPDSIRAHQRLGAERTGWAVFLRIGSFQLMLTSLGQLKCRRLEHGAYPALDVRAPVRADAAPGRGAEQGDPLAARIGSRGPAAGGGR